MASPVFMLLFVLSLCTVSRSAEADEVSPEGFRIEGRVSVPGTKAQEWMSLARLLVDGGEFTAQLRTDGSFIVHNIPSGSYVVEVASPNFKFDPVRVDITSKGKIRARKVNYIKSSEVVSLPYPLRLRAVGAPSYFLKRETWKWTDFLFNPMDRQSTLYRGLQKHHLSQKHRQTVHEISNQSQLERFRAPVNKLGHAQARVKLTGICIYINFIKEINIMTYKRWGSRIVFILCLVIGYVLMMAVPLLIIFLLPKVVNTNDPEMRKEMEQSMNMLSPNKDLPDVSELMTRFFTSKKSSKSSNSNSGGGKGSKPSALKRR